MWRSRVCCCTIFSLFIKFFVSFWNCSSSRRQKLWLAKPGTDSSFLRNAGSHTMGDLAFGSISIFSQRCVELLSAKSGLGWRALSKGLLAGWAQLTSPCLCSRSERYLEGRSSFLTTADIWGWISSAVRFQSSSHLDTALILKKLLVNSPICAHRLG